MQEYTYQTYCADLDNLLQFELNGRLFEGVLSTVAHQIYEIITSIKSRIPVVPIKEFIVAFKQTQVYELLKVFGFSLKKMLSAINDVLSVIDDRLLDAVQSMRKTNVFQKLEQKVISFDQVLADYPIIKKITGPIVAGILLMIWLNMTFDSKFKNDMDLTNMLKALVGKFSLQAVFTSPDGVKMLVLLGTGVLSGGVISFPWLGHTILNLAMALTYSAFKLIKSTKVEFMNALRRIITSEKTSMTEQLGFQQYIQQKEIESTVMEYLFLMEQDYDTLTPTLLEDIVGVQAVSGNTKFIEEGAFDNLLREIGLHLHKNKRGLIQYLIAAGKAVFQMFGYALKGDKQGILSILHKVTKEDVVDFLLKLDMATLHIVTGPIHFIDAVTGWHIWSDLERRAKGAEEIVTAVITAVKKVKDGLPKIFKMPERITKHEKNLDDLETELQPFATR